MSRYIVIFIVFSFLGWIWESVYCTVRQKKWANRGFLYGPVCPIYGFGCVVALAVFDLCSAGILPDLPWWLVFIIGFAVSMILEYPTSYVLEKLFHARWWDYSDVPLNINGRTSVPTSAAFGAASIAAFKIAVPFFSSVLSALPDRLITLTAFVFTAVISADATLTASALTDFQKNIRDLDESFQNHMTEAVYQMMSAGSSFRLKAIKRIAVFRFPAEKAKALKKERRERFDEIAGEYLRSPDVRSMAGFMQHGNTTTLEHSENVAWVSFMVNEKLHLNANEKTLVEAAILHDFYLYDWHDGKPERKRHGFEHPDISCKNAKERFDISKDVEDAVRSHMWPLTIKKIPKSKEALILCLVDKYCALVETMRLCKHLGMK